MGILDSSSNPLTGLFGGLFGGSKQIPPSASETALAQIAQQAFARQKAVYDPLVQKYITASKDTTTPVSQVRGMANVSTQQAFGQATPTAVASTQARGGNVGATIADLNLGKAQSGALGQSNAIGAGKNLSLSRTNQLIGYGRNQPVQAVTGLGSTGQAALNTSITDAEIAANQKAQLLGLAGTVAGGAAGAGGFGRTSVTPPGSSPVNASYTPYSDPYTTQMIGFGQMPAR